MFGLNDEEFTSLIFNIEENEENEEECMLFISSQV